MDWTEILITVNTEAVEAVANFIHESGAGGAVIENNDNGSSTVTAYYPVGPDTEKILADLEKFWAGLESLDFKAEAQVRTTVIAEQDWAEEWKKYYHPVEIGNIYISPSWLQPAAGPDKIFVQLDPGMAFGTGIHPTTQMCIREISALAAGKTVLDLGSGSGILSIVAAKSGAAQVDAVDNDDLAVKVAAENARINQCKINQIRGDAFIEFKNSSHDLAVANIGYRACSELAEIFRQGKKCTLILSGFPQERLAEFEDHYGDLVVRTHQQDGWVCLVLEAK
jgi:ribosomal protein L11 methyltransferase